MNAGLLLLWMIKPEAELIWTLKEEEVGLQNTCIFLRMCMRLHVINYLYILFQIELRLTLHSSQPCFEEIADRVANLSVEEINKDRCLQENCIEVVSKEKACVIVDVRITNSKVDVSASMEYLVECLMKHSDAFQLLCDNKVTVLNLFGYYYQPYEYIDSSGIVYDSENGV